MESSRDAQRKNEHLSLAEGQFDPDSSFEDLRLIHHGLPELGLEDVSQQTRIGDLILEHPYYIEAMTGGSQRSVEFNRDFAKLAAKHHLAIATGSTSLMIKDPAAAQYYDVFREEDPDGLLFANFGADMSVNAAKQIVDRLAADAIEIHINAAQEIVMPEGDRSFRWLDNIARLVEAFDLPVIVKEVGFGMSHETVDQLTKIGVQYINISGTGGTNFAKIENRRNHDNDFRSLFTWGQTTLESLFEARETQAQVIASGGVRSPLDVLKCGVLGAQAVGVAGYFLFADMESYEYLDEILTDWDIQMDRLLLLTGCKTFSDLTKVPFVVSTTLKNYLDQRHIQL